jgi:ATP-grasp domain-containing protein
MGAKGTRATVLVLPTGVRSGPWACRSLRRAGFRVVGANDAGAAHGGGRSLACRDLRPYPSACDDAEEFLTAFEGICRRERVDAVLPLSESLLHLLVDSAPDLGGAILVGPTREQYELLCDKSTLEAAAERAGVAVPRSVVVAPDGAEGELPPLPSVVKPATSATPYGGRVVYRPVQYATTERARELAVARVLLDGDRALVQEFLPGPEWLVDFFRQDDGFVALTRVVVREGVTETVPPPDGLVAATQRLVDAVGFRGVGQAQFLCGGHTPCVHDVNLRVTFGVAAAMRAGLDLPRLAVEHALGLPTVVPRRLKPVRYVWLGGEARQLLGSGPPSTAQPSATTFVRELVLATLLPRRILDPVSLADPLVLVASVRRAVSALVGRLRRRRARRPVGVGVSDVETQDDPVAETVG